MQVRGMNLLTLHPGQTIRFVYQAAYTVRKWTPFMGRF